MVANGATEATMTALTTPTTEQEQRAKYDAVLADIELKQEQLRQLRVFDVELKQQQLRQFAIYEPRRLAFQLLGAVAALLLSGAAFAGSVLAVSNWIARQPPQTINVHLDAPLTVAPK
jgi:hypothetical protein